jgi:hypothetical protein
MARRSAPHKRVNSAKDVETVASKRARRQSATKSKYFTKDEDEGSASAEDENGSDYDEDEEPEEEVPSEEDENESDISDAKPKKGDKSSGSNRNSSSGRQSTGKPSLKANDLLKHGKTGLGSSTEVIIKKPKARSAGNTPYTDGTIHPNTMLFLQDLAANNNRSWLKSEQSFFLSWVRLFSSRRAEPIPFSHSPSHLSRGAFCFEHRSLGPHRPASIICAPGYTAPTRNCDIASGSHVTGEWKWQAPIHGVPRLHFSSGFARSSVKYAMANTSVNSA